MGRLDSKVAVITGAASGIGLESAYLFVKEGACVVACDINEQTGKAAVESILAALPANKDAPKIIFCKADVANEQDIKRAVELAESEFGKLNIMFNNAGIMHPSDGNAESTDEHVWDLTMQINVKGVWFGCKHALNAIRRSGEPGSVINTASFVGKMGAATPQLAYTTSKGAVLAMTKELAAIHARENIRFNALCPGPLRTPLLMNFLNTAEKQERRLVHVPMGRFGEAVEQAYSALFLASDESSYITGTDFMCDGGLTSTYVTPLGDTKSIPVHHNFSGV